MAALLRAGLPRPVQLRAIAAKTPPLGIAVAIPGGSPPQAQTR